MKSITLIIIAALVGIGLLVGVIGAVYVGSTYNTAATLRNSYNMKVKDNESEFDNMFKKIAQATQMSEAKKDAFKEIFIGYATARTNQSQNQLMTWIKEQSPQNVDLSIYDKVLNIITGSRDSWTFRQKELVGIAEQFNRNLSIFPSNFILKLFGFELIDPKVITSGHTKEVFATGEDNDIQLFKK